PREAEKMVSLINHEYSRREATVGWLGDLCHLTSAMRGRRGRREATLRPGPLDRHVRPETSRRRSQVQRPSLPNVAHQEITGLRGKDGCDSSPGKPGECPARFGQDVYKRYS